MAMGHKYKVPKRGKKRYYYSSSPFGFCFAGLCFAHDTKAERDAYVKAQQEKGETLVRAVTREHAFRHGLKWPGEKKYVMFIDGRALYIDGYVLPSAELRRKS